MEDLDEVINEQSDQISILFGRVTALGVLIDMLWTNEFSKENDPVKEAVELKDTLLSLITFDSDDPMQAEAVDEIKRRLDSILRRTKHLDFRPPNQKD